MNDAWRVHDRLYEDERVVFYPEPTDVEDQFRAQTNAATASPKLWADAWLLAFARATGGSVVTFDQALAAQGAMCLPPGRS